MAEIIIAKINPSIAPNKPGRIVEIEAKARIPDHTGSGRDYEINGHPLELDLSQVTYRPARVVEKTIKEYGYPDYDNSGVWGYDWSGRKECREVTVTRRVPTRSWPATVISDLLAARETEDEERTKAQDGERTIRILRNGVGTEMLPGARELIIKLDRPVISYHRERNRRWVQTHYYPDYPELSGNVYSRSNQLEIPVDRLDDYSWVESMTGVEISALSRVMPMISVRLRDRLMDRDDQLMQARHEEWLRNHPYGNQI